MMVIAQKWCENNGYVGKGGVVVLRAGSVWGWVNTLRNSEEWSPGCIAVDEDGAEYKAVGGNSTDGAKLWRKI